VRAPNTHFGTPITWGRYGVCTLLNTTVPPYGNVESAVGLQVDVHVAQGGRRVGRTDRTLRWLEWRRRDDCALPFDLNGRRFPGSVVPGVKVDGQAFIQSFLCGLS
jgi:hypothetical protein